MSNPQMLMHHLEPHHLEPHHLEPHHLEPSPSRARRRGSLRRLCSLWWAPACVPCGVQAYHARLNGKAHLVFAIS